MLKVNDWIKRLKYLAFNRTTYYDNSFPANCGEINPDGSISFDCIGMEKSVLNEPDIVYRTKPAGYHVKPGQVVPDWADGAGILGLCTDAKWWDFSTIVPGEHLYMRTDGHGGVYVGEFVHAGLTYNVIECTAAWAGGVIPTYLDKNTGARLQYKGGPQCYAWEAHGKLSKYIDYSERLEEDGDWGVKTTKFAQTLYKCKTINGKIVHQKKSYKKVCPACNPKSWKFSGTQGYSPLIARIQKECGVNYKKTSTSYGKMTKKTRKRFQKMLGRPVTGVIVAADVKAFQKYLNKKAQKK